LDGATGDLQVLGAEGAEAEGADDDGGELYFIITSLGSDVSFSWCVYIYTSGKMLAILLLTLVNAELGTWAPTAMMNSSQVFGSSAACFTWYHLKWRFLTPWRLVATRSTAIARSRSVRNLAVEGRSGSMIKDQTPIAMETAPKMIKTYIHLGRPVVMFPTA
jgi:hypothetical protein